MAAISGFANLRNWTKREYIIGGAYVGTVVVMLIIVGVLAAHTHSSSIDTCSTPQCLESAAYVAYNMNNSIDPCTDFYQYACGGYAATRPVRVDRTSRTTLSDVYFRNEKKIQDLLLGPYSRTTEWAAERKLKDLYRSCVDDYKNEQKLGTPFIDKILRGKMGGWYVLDGSVPASFDLNNALKVVQTDLWVGAFWANNVGFDWLDMSKMAVQLHPAGAGRYMWWSYYTRADTAQYRMDYKKFMTRLANLLVRDSKLTVPDKDARIQTFVTDAFGMETKLAQLYQTSGVTRNRYNDANKITLDDLKTQTGNVIDWTAQMKYEFSSLTGSSKVILYKKDFIFGLTNLINNLAIATKNRILHNYFIWRLLESYATDLSWEYVHANREYFVDIYGYANFLGKEKWCFSYTNRMMPEAMGALYVRDHFADKNRAKAVEITNYMKSAMIDEINENNWIDGPTKALAVNKLKKLVYKIGYPDFMLNADKLDTIYKQLTVNISDYFQNVLNVNQFQKTYYENQLAGGVDRTKWSYKTFDTNMALLFYWNEIIVPAGFLQSPLYDYHTPHYMSFGSLGTVLGHFVTHIVDQRGSYWTAEGKYNPDTWWTNGTTTAYDSVKTCVQDYYTNKTQGPFTAPNGDKELIPIRAAQYVREAIAITTGVKLAYRAYQKWESDHSYEKAVPSLGLSNEQMFFIAHAQTWCYNRNSNQAYTNAIRGRVEEDVKTNLGLSQLPEFQSAFKCKEGSKMNAPSKCGYY